MSANKKGTTLPIVNKSSASITNKKATPSASVPLTTSMTAPCPTKIVVPSNGRVQLPSNNASKLPKIASPSKTPTAKLLKPNKDVDSAASIAEAEAKRLEEEKNALELAKRVEEARLAEEVRLAEVKRLEEEVAAEKIRGNGIVTLIYERYNEQFPIVDGTTTAGNIDEVYCLSFVMPNCLIHLSTYNPTEKRKLEIEGNIDYFLKEDPRGTYHGLEKDQTYYVYVEQEADQLARDQERQKRIASNMDGINEKGIKYNREQEGCSCLYGNPCMDEYICKDWHNRFSVARMNGWKAFPGIEGT